MTLHINPQSDYTSQIEFKDSVDTYTSGKDVTLLVGGIKPFKDAENYTVQFTFAVTSTDGIFEVTLPALEREKIEYTSGIVEIFYDETIVYSDFFSGSNYGHKTLIGDNVITCIGSTQELQEQLHSPVKKTIPTLSGYEVWLKENSGSLQEYLAWRNTTNAEETAANTADPTGDKFYKHDQVQPSATWNVQHDLDKYPSVFTVDSANTAVEGCITYNDLNNVTINFSAPFSGFAYFN